METFLFLETLNHTCKIAITNEKETFTLHAFEEVNNTTNAWLDTIFKGIQCPESKSNFQATNGK